jgi:hypothetical protein
LNVYEQPHDVGSFGAAVLRSGEAQPLLLTAAHVVGSLCAAHSQARTDVLLRTGVASTSSGDPQIGEVIESHPPEPCEEVQVDACLVRVGEHVSLRSVVREYPTSGRARDLRDVEDLVTVYKRGIRDPGLTRGLLDPTPVSLKVDLPQPSGPPVVRDYLQGWFVYGDEHPFARQGDSGAIVTDEDDCVVALVVALRTDTPHAVRVEDPAFVVPILDVLAGLDVSLAGPDRQCALV